MIKKYAHIFRYLLGFIPAMLTVATAVAQKPVQTIEAVECETIQFEITEFPGDEYTWDIYQDSTGNFATNQGDMESAVYFEDGMYRGSTVRVLNLPHGNYFLRVMAWDEVKCTNNLIVFKLNVIEPPPPELIGDSLCYGEVPIVRVIFTGTGPWDFEYAYSDAEGNTVNLNGHTDDPDMAIPIMTPLPEGKAKFWIMSVDYSNGCTVKTYEEEEQPHTGILIYPIPAKKPIYLKEN
ncbi:hypothetical protein [uncultured Draconibacterium sp.]|uniref:hypothetical protein n=1 Tax=uncultured Draconibacterium sp. TaxID=1573823 RepID=UPI003260E61D